MPQQLTVDSSLLFDQRRALASLRRHLVAMTAVAVLGALIGVAFALTSPVSYQASTQLQLGPAAVASVLGLDTSQTDALTAQSTAVSLLQSSTVKDAVERRLGDVEDVVVTPITDSSLVSVSTSAGDRRRAVIVTQAYVDAYMDLLRTQTVQQLRDAQAGLQSQLDSTNAEFQNLQDDLDASSLSTRAQVQAQQAGRRAALADATGRLSDSQARVSAALAAPPIGVQQATQTVGDALPRAASPVKDAVLGGLCALALAAAVVLVRSATDDRVHDPRELIGISGERYLGVIPSNGDLAHATGDGRRVSEAWRVAWAQLGAGAPPLRNVLVVPAGAAGTSDAAFNLAEALTGHDRRVVFADLTHESESDGSSGSGLGAGPEQSVQELLGRVTTGTTGSVRGPLVQVLTSSPRDRTGDHGLDDVDLLLATASRTDEVVVLSAPSVTLSGTAAAAAARSAVVVLVAVLGRSTRDELAASLRALDRLGARVGVVAQQAAGRSGRRRARRRPAVTGLDRKPGRVETPAGRQTSGHLAVSTRVDAG